LFALTISLYQRATSSCGCSLSFSSTVRVVAEPPPVFGQGNWITGRQFPFSQFCLPEVSLIVPPTDRITCPLFFSTSCPQLREHLLSLLSPDPLADVLVSFIMRKRSFARPLSRLFRGLCFSSFEAVSWGSAELLSLRTVVVSSFCHRETKTEGRTFFLLPPHFSPPLKSPIPGLSCGLESGGICIFFFVQHRVHSENVIFLPQRLVFS